MALFVNEGEISQPLAEEVQQRYTSFSLFGKFDVALLVAVLVICAGVALWLRDLNFVLVLLFMLLILVAFYIPKRRSVQRELQAIQEQNTSLPFQQRVEVTAETLKVKRAGQDSFKEPLDNIVGYYETAHAHALVLRNKQLVVLDKEAFSEGTPNTFFDFMHKLPIRKRVF